MGALFKLILIAYLMVLILGAIVAVIIFSIDVFRWHDREERIKIIPSNDEEREASQAIESEVIDNDIVI